MDWLQLIDALGSIGSFIVACVAFVVGLRAIRASSESVELTRAALEETRKSIRIAGDAEARAGSFDRARILLDAMETWIPLYSEPAYPACLSFIEKNPGKWGELYDRKYTEHWQASDFELKAILDGRAGTEYKVDSKENASLNRQAFLAVRRRMLDYCNILERVCVPFNYNLVDAETFNAEFYHALHIDNQFVFWEFIEKTDIYPSIRAYYNYCHNKT